MTTRIAEDILLTLMQLGMADQSMLANVKEEMEMLRINAKCDRDKAIIEFLFSTVCRVTECEQLNRNDIDFNLRECTVLGKGNKERRVFLSPRCAAVLQLYLKSRKDKDPALFVSPFRWVQDKDGKMVRKDKPTRLLKSGIENVVRQAGKRAGNQRLAWRLRHDTEVVNNPSHRKP